ncbi:hypothetical protein ABB37_00951 [Leptomonas pyrrhocoris]|uniref:Uncharacterized protein n=1 Tax=Leptomonas pyrrhocoris TaxID=157538 RepID=A0A0M9GBF3_LEPPY|nr:hypothetical protein ABB37_00951 [Leptomonas pyrrhocoris]KPA86917.1 hypothetical protein ABB37_00951 [Leptomonas pyrrhocoris]|eukprot:XP_015665356.1 hypothetical protein ABB37_00951 [Leptomonas pyrrhocoris]
MDTINLSSLFRAQQPEAEVSECSSTYESSTTPEESSDKATSPAAGENTDDRNVKDKLSVSGKGRAAGNDVIGLAKAKRSGVRPPLDGHHDPTSDTLSLRSYWIALFSPQVYMAIFYALRITFMVALPLGVFARHPNLMNVFPAHVVIPLWGIVDCRYTFGEQVAFNICSLQCAVAMITWGVLNNAWHIHTHPAGWWCSVIFCVFFISLFGDVRSRRVVMLQCVLILQMESLPGGTELIYPVKVGRDLVMATGFAFFQCLFPVKSIARDCDEMMAGGWKHIGRIARNCVTACWSEDPIECAIALTHIGTEPIQSVLATLPSKLFFVMYEFWESTLRLELRRERLTVMQICMPRLHTMTDTARAMVLKRVHRAHVKRTQGGGSHSPAAKPEGGEHSSCEAADGHGTRGGARMDLQSREPYGAAGDADSCGDVADMQRRQRREAERDEFLKNVAGAEPTDGADGADGADGEEQSGLPQQNSGLLVMQFRTRQWDRTSEILKQPVQHYLDALDAVLEGLGKHLNPHETAQTVPFADLREAATDLQSKLDEVHFEALIKSETPVDPFLYSNVFAFHLSLVVLAERLLEYGERMHNFDRSQYKSQLRRTWEFFFYDYWRDFWEELPKRMTLATPRDVRIFKDAIKMACAYGVGAMFTENIDPDNIYYFGMAILMGVGWPTAGDTMEASVYRVTGMACACSIAYVAIWHTPNLAGELAIAVAAVFISLCFRDRHPYAHTAQYCSILVITALNSAGTKLVLLSRIVSNCFTVMSYYAIVVFIFPIDVLRVTYNSQVEAITSVADRFSRLVDVIGQPFSPDDPEQFAAMKAEVTSIRASRISMWMALNNVGMWLPKAAADPAPLGNPYPLQAMRDMYSSLRRLGSATDVISTSLSALFNDNVPRRRPDVEHIVEAVAPVMQMVDEASRVLFQDFLDAFSTPHEWSPTLTTYHFSLFLSLSRDLHHAFWTAHRRNVKALRANFRERVMNRTFAAAAMTRVVDPLTLERARDLSFAVQPSESFVRMPVARRGERQNVQLAPTPTPGTADADVSVHQPDAFDPADAPAPVSTRGHENPLSDASPLGSARAVRRRSTVRNASIVSGASAAPAHDGDETPAVTNGSIARTIAESMALVRATERRNSRLVRRDVSERGADGRGDGGENVDEVSEQHQRAKEQAEFEKVLDPYERQAQEEERRAFIARRSLEHERIEDSTLSHDVNMVLTILVGTDMFFAEAERMLKTMYAINEYAKSRVPPRKRKGDADLR